GYYASGHVDPNGPQPHPPHAEEAAAYRQPGSAFEPNTHYGHQGGAQTSGEFHAPIGADGPIEVDPSDIMEVDAEDLIPVEPEPARPRPASAIPELSLGLDLDSPLSRPEPSPALANGRAALPDEVPLLDFSEADPNAVRGPDSPVALEPALGAGAQPAPLAQASRPNSAGQFVPSGSTESELRLGKPTLSRVAKSASSPLPISWDDAVAALPDTATETPEGAPQSSSAARCLAEPPSPLEPAPPIHPGTPEDAAAPSSIPPSPLEQAPRIHPGTAENAAAPSSIQPSPLEPAPRIHPGTAENTTPPSSGSASPVEPAPRIHPGTAETAAAPSSASASPLEPAPRAHPGPAAHAAAPSSAAP